MKNKLRVVSVLLTIAILLGATSPIAADPMMAVIAEGLNNPRGIALGPDGALYVAEAGVGGAGPCVPGPEGEACFGMSGSIARVDLAGGGMTRISEGFPSLADPAGFGATGLHDISFNGSSAFLAIGMGGPPEMRAVFGEGGAHFAHLARRVPSGKIAFLTDLGLYETENDPDGAGADTNPYSVLALPGKQIVVDAGANALIEVSKTGEVRTLAVFPDRMVAAPPFLGLPPGAMMPMQSVPTSVALGPDGYYYVGELTGFPFPVGGANVYRVHPDGGTPEIAFTGFTNIIDLGFSHDGHLCVLEITKNGLLSGDMTGALIHVNPDGTQMEMASDGLVAPGGLAFGHHSMFVSNFSIFPGAGQVVEITH